MYIIFRCVCTCVRVNIYAYLGPDVVTGPTLLVLNLVLLLYAGDAAVEYGIGHEESLRHDILIRDQCVAISWFSYVNRRLWY